MSKIITIGRQFGSGGRELGRRLAENLGYEYYDREIITEISKKTDMAEGYVKQIVEKYPHNLFPITIGNTISYVDSYYMQQVQSVYSAQCEIIRELVQKSNCVIIGRCADYILRDVNPFRIFVYASMDSRVQRCMSRANEDEKYTEKDIISQIKNVDKNRRKYYEFYTSQKWGDIENYDLCVNTTNKDIKSMVLPLSEYIMK